MKYIVQDTETGETHTFNTKESYIDYMSGDASHNLQVIVKKADEPFIYNLFKREAHNDNWVLIDASSDKAYITDTLQGIRNKYPIKTHYAIRKYSLVNNNLAALLDCTYH